MSTTKKQRKRRKEGKKVNIDDKKKPTLHDLDPLDQREYKDTTGDTANPHSTQEREGDIESPKRGTTPSV